MLPRIRPLSRNARRQLLRKAASYEVARLRKAAEPATPDPIDDEPATVAIPVETMREIVERRAA